MKKEWSGRQKSCNFCHQDLSLVDRFYDGRTIFGCWALMCPECWVENGCRRIGVGNAQVYDGRTFAKIA